MPVLGGGAARAAAVVLATVLLAPAPPVQAAPDDPHLPEVVNVPGAWSDEEGPDGPLAALGLGLRTEPEGVTGERQSMSLFGVSADDGASSWIDLPGTTPEDRGFIGWFALSPDGRWIGWTRHAEPRRPRTLAPLVGWSVMSTTTGKVRDLAVLGAPRLRVTAAELAFSGDSRYLLTSHELPGGPARGGHTLTAWDVETGAPTVLEEPGHYWLPDLGSAPSGVVWSRGRDLERVDPATGDRTSYRLDEPVVMASWAPDDRAFAWIGRSADDPHRAWRLYAGRSLANSLRVRIDTGDGAGFVPRQILGWVDSTHVVVGHFRTTVHVVDIETGKAEALAMAGAGETFNPPLLAADLWQQPLGPAAPREGTTDPRRPWRWAGGSALVVAAVGALVLRRRRRAPVGEPAAD